MKKESENAVDTKQNAYGMKLNNKREKSALVRLTYVASGSVVKRSLNMNNEEKEKRKYGFDSQSKQIPDDTNGSRMARSRTRKDKRYMWFPVGPNSVGLG
ncbi:hypothetical protein T02_15535 [Trichinella nativa]|uniref:Uncharacterized protein n=1 Tax=Trichinella nativa TaxID=6335 RepID=A0A0V1KK95_9BILA|nr:hypothetical protein T02_4970 [Trichinella nativa]KRZ58760.1 hypothetical protein T02_15535 [Trichinella nativa]